MANDYEFYFAALKDPGAIGKSLAVHENDPQSGMYRMRRHKNAPLQPVALWRIEGELVAMIGEDMVDPHEIWTHCCRNPVTEEAYRTARFEGTWPDQAPGIGHNEGPAGDFEALADQIESARACVDGFARIADDVTQAQAQSARARLNELSGQADKKRVAEKAPHLEASREVDAKWQPLVKAAKDDANRIAKAMGAYETEKARKADEERRRRAEEDRKADEARRAAEAAGKPPVTEEEAPPPPASEPEPVQTVVKGAYGRGATVKVVKIATVVDQDATYQALRNRPEIRELIATLAQRAVNAGHEIAGVEITEERRVA